MHSMTRHYYFQRPTSGAKYTVMQKIVKSTNKSSFADAKNENLFVHDFIYISFHSEVTNISCTYKTVIIQTTESVLKLY